MMKHLLYFKYLMRHKWFVFVASRRLRVPVWRAILHDWSKFMPVEWGPYVRYFYGSSVEKDLEAGAYNLAVAKRLFGEHKVSMRPAFNYAWLHHQHVNAHHWEHWVLQWDDGFATLEMPEHFAREMVADWMGAGRAITGRWEVVEWYAGQREIIVLHEQTRTLVDRLIKEGPK